VLMLNVETLRRLTSLAVYVYYGVTKPSRYK
jgi:hypothetical protein